MSEQLARNILIVVGGIAFFALMVILNTGCGPDDESETQRVVYKEGVNCYDHTGDRNGDGKLTSADCVGNDGLVGERGPAGADADECHVTEVDQGVLIACPNQEPKLVRHGSDGANGQPGENYATELVYQGAACGRTIVSLGKQWYVFHTELMPINNVYVKISNTCSVRYNTKKKRLETK